MTRSIVDLRAAFLKDMVEGFDEQGRTRTFYRQPARLVTRDGEWITVGRPWLVLPRERGWWGEGSLLSWMLGGLEVRPKRKAIGRRAPCRDRATRSTRFVFTTQSPKPERQMKGPVLHLRMTTQVSVEWQGAAQTNMTERLAVLRCLSLALVPVTSLVVKMIFDKSSSRDDRGHRVSNATRMPP
ncbi:hypothetical protein EV126DRAFT_222259 [Verticillium dahliae]|nr:hypothetical protein EV126DRAFT_222259 [Verticillium dahliae]